MLVELTAEFVKELNLAIERFDHKDMEQIKAIEQISSKITNIMQKCENSENSINISIAKIEECNKVCKDVVYVRKDENLCAIVSRDVLKPNIRPINKLEIECNCLFPHLGQFEENKGYVIIDSEDQLRKLDNTLDSVVLGVFDHDYRSFEGFTCYIAIYLQNGYIYIIDAIKFRDIIPQLRLLTCEVKKIVCSQKNIDRLIKDYGSIGCYQNYNVPETNLFVDWRIRPLNDVFCGIICNDLINAVEKYNQNLIIERHEVHAINEVEDFMNVFDIHESLTNLIVDLINLRAYLAKKNDESPQFVMTDTQLYQLVLNMPASVEEFEALFDRMSFILRLHVGDFLLILSHKLKTFSMEKLKSKKEEVLATVEIPLEDRHRSFNTTDENNYTCETDESSFEISD